MKPIRVLLADDHTLVRAGIRSLLHTIPDIEVVGEASDGEGVLRLVALHHPDIVLTDIAMPGLSGLEVAARLAAEHPGIRVIILSMHTTEAHVLQALRSGAMGYLVKDAAPVELELALRAVASGQNYLSPSVSKHVVATARQKAGGGGSSGVLTPRQNEVLRLVAQGRTMKEIGRQLDISVKTVETHRQQLMDRLNIYDVAGLVRYAIRTGLITDE
jgi:DNA-binding NarL/FixJ family response regulator